MTPPLEDLRPRPTRFEAEQMLAQVAVSLFDAPPARVGRFRIEERIGAGGMGTVYRAHDPELDRPVALKILRRRDGGTEADEIGSPLREARAAARVVHPNVVAVHEVGTVDDEGYVAMELVSGVTLRAWLEQRPRPVPEILDVLAAAGRGLAAAHAVDLVHRDFKPDNVLISDEGQVKVVDFGLARLHTQIVPGEGAARLDPQASASMTRTFAGTPAYMAPELHDGRRASPASDQFAFCVALYEGLYGRRPFSGSGVEALAVAVGEGRVDYPRRAGLSRRVVAIVRRGLQTEPRLRWPSMLALLDALAKARRRPRIVTAAGVLATAVAGAAAAMWMTPPASMPASMLASMPMVSPCEDAAAPIEAAWNDDRRDALRSVLGGTPQAEHVVGNVVARLNDYAEAWVGASARHCEAVRSGTVRPALAAQADRCIERRVVAFVALLEVLETSEGVTPEEALEAVDGMSPVAACEDEQSLRAMPDPPTDPVLAERVRAEEAELERARVLGRTGAYEHSMPTIEEVTATARELGYPPLLADALSLHGRAQAMLGREQATETLEEAVLVAESVGYDRRKTDVLIYLVTHAAYHEDDVAAARAYARRAEASLARIGDDPAMRAELLVSRAVTHWMDQDLELAFDLANEAVDLWSSAELPTTAWFISALNLLAILHTQRAEWDQAQAVNRRALEVVDARYGPGSPKSLGILHNIAVTLDEAGDHGAAIGEMKEVLRGQRARGEAGRTHAVRAQRALCRMYKDVGDLVEAQACIEEALQAATLVGRRFEIRETRILATELARRMGRHDEAVHQACQAWALMRPEEGNQQVIDLPRLLAALEVDHAELDALCGDGDGGSSPSIVPG